MSNDNTASPGSRCLFCGRSTLRRRGGSSSRRQLRSFELSEIYLNDHPDIRAYAQHKLSTQKITGRICYPCVQCASRYFTREQEHMAIETDTKRNDFELSEGSSEAPVNDAFSDDSQGVSVEVPIEPADDAPDEDFENNLQNELEDATNVQSLPVPGFSRVSYVSCCLVAGCNVRSDLYRINTVIRTAILRERNIYIPPAVRVCNKHLNSNVIWRDFPDYTRSRHETFDSTQIADMLRLLQRPIDHLNFGKLNTIDDD